VYGRVSHQIEWIRATTCQISADPPADFRCQDYPDLPAPENPGNPGNGDTSVVPVTVVIQFDDFPEEIGWSISDSRTGVPIVEVPIGTYTGQRSRVQETVFLPGGMSYFFTVDDTYGDGLCCNTPGTFMLLLGRNNNGEILLTGGKLSSRTGGKSKSIHSDA
jgi:hypothetical protein